jgi:hypothetical protein
LESLLVWRYVSGMKECAFKVSLKTCSPSESAGFGSDDRRRMPPVRQAHAIITFSAVRCGYSGVRLTCALSALLLQAEER